MLLVPGEEIRTDNLEKLIDRYMAFIIRTTSKVTGRYVSIEHDEEFSIALSAFAEAVERYEKNRGNFLSFAGLVMESRLKSYLGKSSHLPGEVSLEELQESGQDFADNRSMLGENNGKENLHEEILLFRQELLLFGLTLEALVDDAPKHADTRKTAVDVAEQASWDQPTVELTYKKRNFPYGRSAGFAMLPKRW